MRTRGSQMREPWGASDCLKFGTWGALQRRTINPLYLILQSYKYKYIWLQCMLTQCHKRPLTCVKRLRPHRAMINVRKWDLYSCTTPLAPTQSTLYVAARIRLAQLWKWDLYQLRNVYLIVLVPRLRVWELTLALSVHISTCPLVSPPLLLSPHRADWSPSANYRQQIMQPFLFKICGRLCGLCLSCTLFKIYWWLYTPQCVNLIIDCQD